VNRQIRVGDFKCGTFDDEFLPLTPLALKSPNFTLQIMYFFSFIRPDRTVALILMLNGSNDVFSPKDGPWGGGWTMSDVIWGKNSPKRGANRQFQAKTPKSIHRNIFGTINPTNKRFEDTVQTTKGTSWVVCYYPKANTIWLTSAILKIDITS